MITKGSNYKTCFPTISSYIINNKLRNYDISFDFEPLIPKTGHSLDLKTEQFFNVTKITVKSNGQTFRTRDVRQTSRGA